MRHFQQEWLWTAMKYTSRLNKKKVIKLPLAPGHKTEQTVPVPVSF